MDISTSQSASLPSLEYFAVSQSASLPSLEYFAVSQSASLPSLENFAVSQSASLPSLEYFELYKLRDVVNLVYFLYKLNHIRIQILIIDLYQKNNGHQRFEIIDIKINHGECILE